MCCIVLYWSVLYCIICIVLYCIVLYCIILYYVVLFCIVNCNCIWNIIWIRMRIREQFLSNFFNDNNFRKYQLHMLARTYLFWYMCNFSINHSWVLIKLSDSSYLRPIVSFKSCVCLVQIWYFGGFKTYHYFSGNCVFDRLIYDIWKCVH